MTVLVTGGAGFFGGLLKNRLLKDGIPTVSLDLEPDDFHHPQLTTVQGDICDRDLVAKLFEKRRFESVYHCAAMLAHAVKDKSRLWTANVEGTHILAENARRFGTKNFVFTSSNCLWGHGFGRPVREDDPPSPVEIYGRSKAAAEKILGIFDDLNIAIIRCPTIIDEGRLGLLTILFDFIREGRKVWVIGGGNNRYQFIYAQDLIEACLRAAQTGASGIFHIGSDHVPTMREAYECVIDQAGSGARIASLPRVPTLMAMRVAYWLGLSPLGPYQYKMIAEDFIFATDKIKAALGWRPTLTNQEMLARAYRYYNANFDEILARQQVSAHRQAAKMGIIRLLKWLS
jgi:nucleoside-diphosphate-sugar epimerase